MIFSTIIWGIILYAIYQGFKRPYVFALLYLWLDFFKPQIIAPKGFEGTQITIVIGLLAVFGLIWGSPKRLKSISIDFVMMLVFGFWITLTTYTAVVQEFAWLKWDWAFKGLMFAALLGQFTEKREQFEAAVLVMIAASLHQILSFAIKTGLGGGGYMADLGLLGDQTTGLGESSTLAVYCASLLPIVAALGRHSILIPATKLRYWASRGLMIACFLTPIGTFARTALVSATFSIGGLAIRRPLGVVALAFGILGMAIMMPFLAGSDWGNRMSTIFSYRQDTSAMGRVAVWRWTWDYVQNNPLGGGFVIDKTNEITISTDEGSGLIYVRGKAFHSIYFEVLGEQGYPGFFMYFSIVLLSIVRLIRVFLGARSLPGAKWERELAYGFLIGWGALLIGAGFVGIAYLPLLFLMMAFSNCIFRFYREKVIAAKAEARAKTGAMSFGARFNRNAPSLNGAKSR
jgi:putative inorganic carbon (hco3(-)) transporter